MVGSVVRSAVHGCLILLLVAAAARGQTRVQLSDGKSVEGELKENYARRIVLRIGGEDRVIPFKNLRPRSAHEMMAKRTAMTDGRGRLALARYAIDNALYLTAKRNIAEAIEADDALIDEADDLRVEIDERRAMSLLLKARKALEAGRTHEADRHLARIVTSFSETRTAEEARTLKDQAEGRIALAQRLRREEKMARHDEKIRARYADVSREIDDAQAKRRKGLMSTSRYRRSLDYFRAGLKKLQKARKGLKRVAALPDSNRACRACGADNLNRIRDLEFQLRIDLAELYRGRSSYGRALEEIDAALILDHRTQEAKELRNMLMLERAVSSRNRNK